MNAINKAAQCNHNPNLEISRRDSLREDGPARGQLLYVPSRVASCRITRKTGGKTRTTEPAPCVIYPKRGKGNAQSKPGKDMVSRPKRMGSGVGYAKGRY